MNHAGQRTGDGAADEGSNIELGEPSDPGDRIVGGKALLFSRQDLAVFNVEDEEMPGCVEQW
jgi:hypothetical protein